MITKRITASLPLDNSKPCLTLRGKRNRQAIIWRWNQPSAVTMWLVWPRISSLLGYRLRRPRPWRTTFVPSCRWSIWNRMISYSSVSMRYSPSQQLSRNRFVLGSTSFQLLSRWTTMQINLYSGWSSRKRAIRWRLCCWRWYSACTGPMSNSLCWSVVFRRWLPRKTSIWPVQTPKIEFNRRMISDCSSWPSNLFSSSTATITCLKWSHVASSKRISLRHGSSQRRRIRTRTRFNVNINPSKIGSDRSETLTFDLYFSQSVVVSTNSSENIRAHSATDLLVLDFDDHVA